MRFVPKKARNDVNVSPEHPLVEAGYLVTAVTLIFAAIVVVLVFAVDLALLFFSPQSEAEFFERWTPKDLVAITEEDTRIVETRELLSRLAERWPDAPYRFRLEVTESELPNAMALPGGLVVVTSALLDGVESENELAFVLGHELGHFRNRDHMRMLGRAAVFGIFFTVISGGDDSNLGLTVAEFGLLGFSREQESDADEFGLELVQAEYGHVAESWRFFERMDEVDDDLPDFATYLSTHPSPDDRVDDIRALALTRGWALTGETAGLDWREKAEE